MKATSHVRLRAALVLAVAAALAACTEAPVTPRAPELGLVNRPFNGVLPQAGDGQIAEEQFQVCKYGSSATFAYVVVDRATGALVTNSTLTLADGECQVIAIHGGEGQVVSITETGAQSGFQLDHVDVQLRYGLLASPTNVNTTSTSPTVVDSITGNATGGATNVLRGLLVKYYNVATPPPPPNPGRMTGGGKQVDINGVSVGKGLTLHCDILLSNNLEINWPGAGGTNNFHITRPLTSATCILDPAYVQPPPVAPFNTFIGVAAGTLNGVGGATARFTFIDGGEPGGANDWSQIQIWDGGGNLVLDVPLSHITGGNLQAHYDQPHGNKP